MITSHAAPASAVLTSRPSALPAALHSVWRVAQDLAHVAHTIWSGRFGWLLRLGITTVLLGVVLSKGEVRRLPEELRHAIAGWLAAALLFTYTAWVVNSLKWQKLLAAYGLRHGIGELFHLNLAGIFYGIALPGQATGDVLKAINLADRVEQRRAVYVSVFLDRITGVVGLAFLGVVALLLAPPTGGVWTVTGVLVLLAALLSGAAISLLATSPVQSWVVEAGSRTALGGWVKRLVGRSGTGVPVRSMLWAFALGALFQAISATTNWFAARALGIQVSPIQIVWIFAMVSLVQMLPISVAGIGPREATYATLLAPYGVRLEASIALSLTMFAGVLVLGLTGWMMELVFSARHQAGR